MSELSLPSIGFCPESLSSLYSKAFALRDPLRSCGAIGASNFGEVTSAYDLRTIELALKFNAFP
jgi:hypothetical protein